MESGLKTAMFFDKVYRGLCEGKKYRRRAWDCIDSIFAGCDNEWYFMAKMKDKRYPCIIYFMSADDIFATDWEEVTDDMDS